MEPSEARELKQLSSKMTLKIWNREYSRRLPRDIQERALMKLQQLNAAGDLKDLSIASSKGTLIYRISPAH